jgi:hypothetical protein
VHDVDEGILPGAELFYDEFDVSRREDDTTKGKRMILFLSV